MQHKLQPTEVNRVMPSTNSLVQCATTVALSSAPKHLGRLLNAIAMYVQSIQLHIKLTPQRCSAFASLATPLNLNENLI